MIIPLCAVALATGGAGQGAGPSDSSPFGIVCPWPRVEETGARWVRCGAGATPLVDWGQVEPQRGQFTWEAADRELREWDLPWGLTPLPILGYTAPWASSAPDGNVNAPPRDLRAYHRFVQESVRRYRGEIEYWEVWNEPNIGFFRGQTHEYVDLLKAAAVAARAANPEAKVLFGGQAGVDLPFTQRCYELGAGDYFDVMAVHPYQWGKVFNDGWFTDKLQGMRALMDQWGDTEKPIWLTEIGWSTAEGVDEQDQARLLVQSFVTALTLGHLGVEKVFWFCVKDWGGPGYGVLADNGEPKPAFHAYRVMTRELAGRPYLGALGSDQGRAYLFGERNGDGQWRLVLWAAGLEDQDVSLRLKCREVRAVSLLGEERVVPAGVRLVFRATPAPRVIRLAAGDVVVSRPAEQRHFQVRVGPRPGVWVSVQPAPGSSRAWLVPGQPGSIECLVRNFTQADQTVCLEWVVSGAAGRKWVDVPAMQSRAAELPVTLPRSALLGTPSVAVVARGRAGGVFGQSTETTVRPTIRVAAGPTTEFLANSHLESLYLQPDAQSGCSESCRFGRSWTYRFGVPFACAAKLSAFVGAHLAGPWTVQWSQDGQQFATLLEGRSDRSWHDASLPGLQPGELYLRFEGTDEQLGELVVTWVRG